MIKAVGLSFLTVKDLERTKQFFINSFGFELSRINSIKKISDNY